MSGASRFRRSSSLTVDGCSASRCAISEPLAAMPSSSNSCHWKARNSAIRSAVSQDGGIFPSDTEGLAGAAASAWAGTMTVHAPRFLNRTGIKVVNLTPVSPVLRFRAAAPACWISFMLPLFPCAQLAAHSAGSQLTGPLLPARFAPLDVDALLPQLHPLNQELHNALLLGGKKLRPQGRQIPQGQYDYGFLDVWRGCLDPLPDRLHDFGRCQRRLHLREYQVFNLSGGQHPHRACARAKAPIPR